MNLTFNKLPEEMTSLWEEINKKNNGTFLSSTDWINFQSELGIQTDKYLISLVINNEDDDTVPFGLMAITQFRRKIAKFAYAAYNPIVDWGFLENETKMSKEELIAQVYSSIQKFQQDYIKENNLNLFRFDPLEDKKYFNTFIKLGYKQSLAPAQAKYVWEIDLTQNEEQLRSGMSKSTRYNVNKTSREGLEFVRASRPEDVKAFSNLMNETTGRKSFSNYNYDYFQKQFDKLNPLGMCDIFLVKFQDKYLAGALVNYYNETAYYTHGCSTSNRELSKMRASYFLQWEIMKLAKVNGFKKYNMWGVVPEAGSRKQEANGMAGVSEFKKSFGGYEIDYVGAIETYTDSIKYNLHRTVDWWSYRKDRY